MAFSGGDFQLAVVGGSLPSIKTGSWTPFPSQPPGGVLPSCFSPKLEKRQTTFSLFKTKTKFRMKLESLL